MQCVAGVVGVGSYDEGVVYAALHAVCGSCHHEVGGSVWLCPDGYGDFAGIVVPKRCEDDVFAFARQCEAESHLGVESAKTAVGGEWLETVAESCVVDLCRQLWVTPFADALCRYLQCGVGWSWTDVFVAEDVCHA